MKGFIKLTINNRGRKEYFNLSHIRSFRSCPEYNDYHKTTLIFTNGDGDHVCETFDEIEKLIKDAQK